MQTTHQQENFEAESVQKQSFLTALKSDNETEAKSILENNPNLLQTTFTQNDLLISKIKSLNLPQLKDEAAQFLN